MGIQVARGVSRILSRKVFCNLMQAVCQASPERFAEKDSHTFPPPPLKKKKLESQFPRYGVGVSLYMTDLSREKSNVFSDPKDVVFEPPPPNTPCICTCWLPSSPNTIHTRYFLFYLLLFLCLSGKEGTEGKGRVMCT